MEWRGIFGPVPDVIVELDASLQGWGARCGSLTTGGKWTDQEKKMHINYLELLAGFFEIKSFIRNQMSCCVLLKMDNISAVRYVNKLGGPCSKGLGRSGKGFLAFLSKQGYHDSGSVHSRNEQYNSRLEFKGIERFQ